MVDITQTNLDFSTRHVLGITQDKEFLVYMHDKISNFCLMFAATRKDLHLCVKYGLVRLRRAAKRA